VGDVYGTAPGRDSFERNPGVRATVWAVATGPDLSKIWLFSTATAKERRVLRQALDEVTVKPGRVLCEEGTVGREFFLIVSGQASVRHNNRKVRVLGPGEYFGELALIDRQPRSATVVADTDMDLLVLAQREFNGVLVTMPELSRKMLIALATRVREFDKKVAANI
jgi:CRP/FNR family cyclic AMP-dependent transcriptional regulator